MFMVHSLRLLALLLLLATGANASVFVGGGVGIMEGFVVEAGYKANPFLSFRGRGGMLPSIKLPLAGKAFETESGTPFSEVDALYFKSQAFDLGAEITPLPFVPILRSVHFIAAVQYLNMDIDMNTNLSNGATFGGTHYSESGNIHAQVQNKNALSPYVAIGFDLISIPTISLRLTTGATFRSYEVSKFYLTGNLATAVSESNLSTARSELAKEIDKAVIVPSITLTARFNMINIPFIPVL